MEIVSRLPVEAWRYKPGFGLDTEHRHIGPYAEDFRESFGLGDGVTLNLVDTTGVTFAAMKGLAKKIRRIEEGFGLGDGKPTANLGLSKSSRQARDGFGLSAAA